MENLATSSGGSQEMKPPGPLLADIEQVHGDNNSAGMHQVKSSGSCSAHSSNSSAWTSSCCEKTLGVSDVDDDDDPSWSPESEPRQRRSIEQPTAIQNVSTGDNLYKRKTPDPISISGYESGGGTTHRGNGQNRKGIQVVSAEQEGANRGEGEPSKEDLLARNEAVDHGYSTKLAGNGMPPRNEIQPEVQVLQLANCNLSPHSGYGTASDSEFLREEDAEEETVDIYPPPPGHLEFQQRSRMLNYQSEDRDHRILDPHFQPECDLYKPIKRAEDARWRGIASTDSSKHPGFYTIGHGPYLAEKLDSARVASSGDFPSSRNSHTHHSQDLYEEKPGAGRSQFVPKSHIVNDSRALSGGIHGAQELGPARMSGLSQSSAHYGFNGLGVPSQTLASTHSAWMNCPHHGLHAPLCSVYHQHSFLQNQQLLHSPPLQENCASHCSSLPMCVVANAPHHRHRVLPRHGQASQYVPPKSVGRQVSRDQNQQRDLDLRHWKTKPRQPRRLPPFPTHGAVPFVLCQHCAQLLQAPACSTPTHATYLKLRCASCSRISKFGVQHSRITHMAPRAFANGPASSSDASVQFPAAFIHVSTVRSGSGEVSNSAVRKDTWSRECSGKSPSPLHRRHSGFVRPFDTTAVAPSKTLTRDSLNPVDANADIPGIEGLSSSTPSAEEGTRNGVKFNGLTQWDSLEEARVTGSSHFKYRTAILLKDVGKSAVIGGFGNNLQVQDCQVPSSSTNDAQRKDSENEDLLSSLADTVRPSSPLYKLLGYKSPFNLRHSWRLEDAEREKPPYDGPYSDACCSARISDASNGSMAKLTFSPGSPLRENLPCHHQITSEASEAPAECPDLKQEGFVNSANNDDNLYPGRRGLTVTTKTLVESEQAAAKFSTGFLKRSLKGLGEKGSQFSGSSRQKVIVNGHVLSSAAIKDAEERAGKLRPGSYWYDLNAGFWGVSGGPCVGVIPPFIEALNFPMARDCSKGETKVLVNGRELCQEDLNKLAHRGLPTEISKAYTISFNGTVIDKSSGKELNSLGKLAPTVERRKKGFGMFTAPAGRT